MANKANSLSHTKWMCKYHIVFTPKYRRKVIYNQYKEDMRDILKQLCAYKGVEIIFFNYNGLRGEGLLEQLKKNTRFLIDSAGDHFLTLSDFTNSYGDDKSLAYLQSEEAKAAAKKTAKKAVLGVTGLKKMFLNIYNKFTGTGTKAFDDIEAAKEYLVS